MCYERRHDCEEALVFEPIPGLQGPAVWALRAQTDKQEYALLMRRLLEDTPNLHLREGQAVGLDLGPNDEVRLRMDRM